MSSRLAILLQQSQGRDSGRVDGCRMADRTAGASDRDIGITGALIESGLTSVSGHCSQFPNGSHMTSLLLLRFGGGAMGTWFSSGDAAVTTIQGTSL